MPRKDLFSIASHFLDYLVPRTFGLHSLRYDSNTEEFVPSRLWFTVCNLSSLFFIAIYPISMAEITSSRPIRANEDNTVGRFMVVSHFAILYVLSVIVVIRQMWFSEPQIHSINRCLKFYRQCETLNVKEMDIRQFIYPFIFRGIYSYSGHAFINFLSLLVFYNDLSRVSFVSKILYFAPNIIITTAAIRFHSGVMKLTMCGRRINRAFSNCIISINTACNQPTEEFEQVCASAMARFEYLTMFHGEWYEITRIFEKRLSLLMLPIVTSLLNNLTSSVNSIYLLLTSHIWSIQMVSFMIFTKLFLLYLHLTGNKEINLNYVFIGIIRCSLHSIDLAFTFLPSNKLKREVS